MYLKAQLSNNVLVTAIFYVMVKHILLSLGSLCFCVVCVPFSMHMISIVHSHTTCGTNGLHTKRKSLMSYCVKRSVGCFKNVECLKCTKMSMLYRGNCST